jgi:cytoplasmic iron level regulating protein YaaA (DUF328/UPF0246 family)
MILLLSPSKTQQYTGCRPESDSPVFISCAHELAKYLKNFSAEELGIKLKIKGSILEETWNYYQNYIHNDNFPAIEVYNGLVFKGLKLDNYTHEQLVYLSDNLRILSALYGILKPSDGIRPHRLDLNNRIFETKTLYEYWGNRIDSQLKHEKQIINLASKEYSRLCHLPMITVSFKELKNGKYRPVGTYSKQARGAAIDYCITNKITSVDQIKKFSSMNYIFNPDLSSEWELIFTR